MLKDIDKIYYEHMLNRSRMKICYNTIIYCPHGGILSSECLYINREYQSSNIANDFRIDLYIYITLYFAIRYYSARYGNIVSSNVEMLNHKFILIMFAIIGSVVVFFVEPKLLIPQDFLILREDYQSIQLDVEYDGLYSTLATLIKPIFFLLVFSFIKRQYEMRKRKIAILLSFFLVIVFMGLYTGTKRWEIVFAGIIGMYLMKSAYGKIPKSLTTGAILVMIPLHKSLVNPYFRRILAPRYRI